MTFSLNELTLLIVAITSFIGLLRSIFNGKKLDDALVRIEIIHKATNSMKDELVKEVREASVAKGIAQERASIAANIPAVLSPILPLPVSDKAAAAGIDRVVDAIGTSGLSKKT